MCLSKAELLIRTREDSLSSFSVVHAQEIKQFAVWYGWQTTGHLGGSTESVVLDFKQNMGCESVCGIWLVQPDSTRQSPVWLENAVVLELSKESHDSLLLMKFRLMSR